jgi:hypothetical protein
MKYVFIFFCLLCVTNCDNTSEPKQSIKRQIKVEQSRFPQVLQNIFQAHGGLNKWQQMNVLVFTLNNSKTTETHTVNKNSRKTLIESDAYTIGFKGDNVWIKDANNNFNNDAGFYYNRMFYLFSMPFIVSDPGTFYTPRKDTALEFETYGTLHIGFRRSVGASPQDEYIIYYNKQTMEMVWLAYTVTYFSQKRSTDWHFIKYENWQDVNGLKLPKTMITYSAKDGKPLEPIDRIEFSEVNISDEQPDDNLFKASKGSRFVE